MNSKPSAAVVRLVAGTRARFDAAFAAGAIKTADHVLANDRLNVIQGRYLDEKSFATANPARA